MSHRSTGLGVLGQLFSLGGVDWPWLFFGISFLKHVSQHMLQNEKHIMLLVRVKVHYPLVICPIAIEHDHRTSQFSHLNNSDVPSLRKVIRGY